MNSTLVFDWAHFNDLTDGDPVFETQILSLFLDNLKTDYASLYAAYNNENWEAWHEWLHKIGGACANLRANEMAYLCKDKQLSNGQKQKAITEAYDRLYTELHAAILSEES